LTFAHLGQFVKIIGGLFVVLNLKTWQDNQEFVLFTWDNVAKIPSGLLTFAHLGQFC